MSQKKTRLRAQLRHQRRALSVEQRVVAAEQFAIHVAKLPIFCRSRRIAVYLSNEGELDLSQTIAHAWRLSKQCYLPVIQSTSSNCLAFYSYHCHSVMMNNRYHIKEPSRSHAQRVSILSLDLVLLPLVAFDQQGNRLGMGGGYYDRTFAFLCHRQYWRRPLLIGVAYGFQQVDALPCQTWDVPIDMVVTDVGVHRFL